MPGVLVVEDEPVVQLHLARLVADLGYDLCGTAADGAEALACAAVSQPDLVLMDVRIPGDLDGIATAGEMAARHGSEVVFVTAHADDDTVSRIEAAGAAAYIMKPFRTPEIRLALATAMRRRAGERSAEIVDLASARAEPRSGNGHGSAIRGRQDAGHRRRRSSTSGRRALLYSHDSFGLGHLRRSLNLARALLDRDPQLSLLLATGSPVVHGFAVPPGMDYLKLPSVRKVGASRYAARSLDLPGGEITALRREILLRTTNDFEPDLLVVDHAPTGMGDEMLPALDHLAKRGSCLRVLGMRDIVDDPTSVRSHWAHDGTQMVLARLYDQVLVYGMQEIFDPIAAYGFEPQIAAKTRFVGYVTHSGITDGEREASFLDALPRPLVVVTIGGGDGALDVLHCWLEMLSRFRSRIDFWSVVLTGPLVPEAFTRQFATAARNLPITLRDFVPSTRPYTSRADLVVCTAGYNTMTEVLTVAERALVIPRILHRKEQLLRAERLAELGLVELMHPEDLDPERLLSAVEAQLESGCAPLRDARTANRLRFDGAERAASLCGELLATACAEVGGLA